MKSHTLGFTLLEVLLVISIIGILGGLSVPIYQSFQVKDDLDIATNEYAQSLRRAQVLTFASAGDSVWGVHIQSGSITIFKGAVFLGRDNSFDEVYSVPATISIAGIQDVIYTKLTGEPTPISVGSTTLSSTTNESHTVTINSKGMVDY